MSTANVIFTLDGAEIVIQCLVSEKMRDICQKFALKAEKDINSFIYLYNGSQLNFDLTFESQANSFDKLNRLMKVLVYKSDEDGYICPNCGQKIKLNLEEIITSFNNIKDNIDGIKLMIENMINNSKINTINNQLKNINILLNSVNEDIKKNNLKLQKIISNNDNINNNYINNNLVNNNIIKAFLDIKINENIILFNKDNNDGIDVYLNNQKINMIKINNNQWKVDYIFKKNGNYSFDIVFNNNITNMERFFENCSKIIALDLSNFDTSKIISMLYMFNGCNKLKEIKGINQFSTNNVSNMKAMFQDCNALEYLDLSNFNTSKVTNMSYMFNKCHNLIEIKGINQFSTNNVTDFKVMFQEC